MKSRELHSVADEAASFVSALSPPALLRIACGLSEGERAAGELARAAGLRAPRRRLAGARRTANPPPET